MFDAVDSGNEIIEGEVEAAVQRDGMLYSDFSSKIPGGDQEVLR